MNYKRLYPISISIQRSNEASQFNNSIFLSIFCSYTFSLVFHYVRRNYIYTLAFAIYFYRWLFRIQFIGVTFNINLFERFRPFPIHLYIICKSEIFII